MTDHNPITEAFAALAEPLPLDPATLLSDARRIRQRRTLLGGSVAAATVAGLAALGADRFGRDETIRAAGPHPALTWGPEVPDGGRVALGCGQWALTSPSAWSVESSSETPHCTGEEWPHVVGRGDFAATTLEDWVLRSHTAGASDLCTAVVPFTPRDAWLTTSDGRTTAVRAHRLVDHGAATLLTWAPTDVEATATLHLAGPEESSPGHQVAMPLTAANFPLKGPIEPGIAYWENTANSIITQWRTGWTLRTPPGRAGALLVATGRWDQNPTPQEQARLWWAIVEAPVKPSSTMPSSEVSVAPATTATAGTSEPSTSASGPPPGGSSQPPEANSVHVWVTRDLEVVALQQDGRTDEIIPTGIGLREPGWTLWTWRATNSNTRATVTGPAGQVVVELG